jgi:hypothetical protein
MSLVTTVALPKGDSTKSIEAGTRIGHAPSVTGFKNWKKFWDTCKEKGFLGQTVKVKFGYEIKKGGGNTWGVATFDLIENVQ